MQVKDIIQEMNLRITADMYSGKSHKKKFNNAISRIESARRKLGKYKNSPHIHILFEALNEFKSGLEAGKQFNEVGHRRHVDNAVSLAIKYERMAGIS